MSLNTKSTVAFQEDSTRVTPAKMSAKLEFIFIHEVCICHGYFLFRTWHCLHMQSVVVAQQMNARAYVDLQLSAEWDHDGSVFLFPVAVCVVKQSVRRCVIKQRIICGCSRTVGFVFPGTARPRAGSSSGSAPASSHPASHCSNMPRSS